MKSSTGTGPKLDNRPLYIRAEEALTALLESGPYQPGDQLPPEPDLAGQLGISRSTLREVMRTFEERALITRRQGVGTFINHPSPLIIESGLETLESVDTLVRRRGMTIQTRDLQIQEQLASGDLALSLQRRFKKPLQPGHLLLPGDKDGRLVCFGLFVEEGRRLDAELGEGSQG